MQRVVINGDEFDDLEGFYSHISSKFKINQDEINIDSLDILMDLLEGGYGILDMDEELKVTWKNFRKSVDDFNFKSTSKYYAEILEDCHPSNRNEIRKLIDDSNDEIGMKLFYLILEVFIDSPNVQIELI